MTPISATPYATPLTAFLPDTDMNSAPAIPHPAAITPIQCGFPTVQSVWPDCHAHAKQLLSADGLSKWLQGAETLCRMGRGDAPVLAFLEEMPMVASLLGEAAIDEISQFVQKLTRTPNGRALAPFLQTLSSAARALESLELLQDYCRLIWDSMQRSSPKVHGLDKMYPSSCLIELLETLPQLFGILSLDGLRNWIDYGLKAYANDPDRQRDYFRLGTPDSRAVVQREQRGTLYVDIERRLQLTLRGLWDMSLDFVPYSLDYDTLRKPVPYLDARGLHLPEVYDDLPHVIGLQRYRALLAHVCAHRLWSSPQVADNLSPFQRISVEIFEDSRVEYLAMQRYPGLRTLWLALHPKPDEHACPPGHACIRHRLAMMSRALLDPQHGYQHTYINEFTQRFHAEMANGTSSTRAMLDMGVEFITRTRQKEDFGPNVWFEDTLVDYRDDNRLLWQFIEEGDEETFPDQSQAHPEQADPEKLPPRLYPEWDYASGVMRPDWVSLYEYLHPAGDPGQIDQILLRHQGLAKQLKKLIDLLKPQDKVRIRYQEEGDELDLDIAIRAVIDHLSGSTPDPRINVSHRHDGRNIAVSLLLDLSASLDDIPEGCQQSKLSLSQEAVSLLGWVIAQMGDRFAIGGFHSNTRHEVRFAHFKGFKETWDTPVKARLAAMQAGYSTRMGAAIRHAGHYLSHQPADKKILLILTDGEPADIDAKDDRLLIEDARVAVHEQAGLGVQTYCITLDPHAGDYVAHIFGRHYSVIDHIDRLPEQLPKIFLGLTK